MNKKSAVDIVAEKLLALVEEYGEFPWEKPWATNEFRSYYGPYNMFNQLFVGLQFLVRKVEMKPYLVSINWLKEHDVHILPDQNKEYFTVLHRWWDRDRLEEYETEAALETNGSPAWERLQQKIEWAKKPKYRYSCAWSTDQTNMSPERVDLLFGVPAREAIEIKREAEDLINGFPKAPKITYNNGTSASYMPTDDIVSIPHKDLFESAQAYYATMFHELTHATGHKSRLNRSTVAGYREGKENRGREELIAETGAYWLCNIAGIEPRGKEIGSYLKGWLKPLKDNPSEIVTACYAAQAAVNWITGKSMALKGDTE